MASLSRTKTGAWIVQFDDGKRRTVRLGPLPDKLAHETRSRIEALIQCQSVGLPPDKATAAWLTGIPDELADRLAAVGLIELRERDTLGPFLKRVLEQKSNLADGTVLNLKQTESRLLEHFGPSIDLRSIGFEEADAWLAGLKKAGYAQATWSAYLKKARQFFHLASRWGLIDRNPFVGLKALSQANPSRMSYVEPATIHVAIERTTAPFGRVLALARFGGLRVPSEIAVLDWSHFDWPAGRLTVHSPKTGTRECPIFPELREILESQRKVSGPVVVGIKTDKNMRSRLIRLLGRMDVKPWPRLFHNMRSSLQSDLVKRHPLHAVCKWLGNSPAIADKHYLQVHDDDFRQAAALQDALQQAPITSDNEQHRPSDVLPFRRKQPVNACIGVPPRGLPTTPCPTLQISNYCRELGFCAVIRAVSLAPVLRKWEELSVRDKASIRRKCA